MVCLPREGTTEADTDDQVAAAAMAELRPDAQILARLPPERDAGAEGEWPRPVSRERAAHAGRVDSEVGLGEPRQLEGPGREHRPLARDTLSRKHTERGHDNE